MNVPLVSIIVPVYNTEQFLRRCLDSVANQTYDNWECICVNDGSPDNSLVILDEYGRRDPRFKIITQKNGGLSAARNTGMENMKGEFFLFVDSDDFIHPQLLEICVHQALRDSSDMVIYKWSHGYKRRVSRLLSWGFAGYMPWFRKYNKERARAVVTDDIYKYVTDQYKGKIDGVDKKLIIRHCGACQSVYRTDLFKDFRFPVGMLFEDVPWWGQVLLRTKKATINNLNLYYYYPNENSITKNKSLLAKRITNMERIIPMAEAIYENAAEYPKRIWNERFVDSFRRKLERYRNEDAE